MVGIANKSGTQIVGNVGDNDADSHGPIKIGGRYNSSEQTYVDGDRADVQMDVNGRLITANVNREATIFASAARTQPSSPFNSADQTNRWGRGVRLYLDITAAGGTTPTLDVKVQTKDPVSGKYIDMAGASFAQKTGTGTDELVIHPAIAASANAAVSDAMPLTWRVVATFGADSNETFTFSVGAAYIR